MGVCAAWSLFDRDATVGWTPGPGTADVVVDFAEQQNISHMKVFGHPGGTLRVGADAGTGVNEWFAESDLGQRTAGKACWQVIALSQAIDARALTLLWQTPPGANEVVGEVEFWGRADQARERIEASRWASEALPSSVDSFASSTAEIELRADAGDGRCGVFAVELGRPSQGYRRTWLVYATEGVFRPFVPTRSVNGAGIDESDEND